ncbi:pantetheine-phosphate adenylyltransferase [Mycoplasmopsis pullorum]|uniref:pantetheine-phosphate adenylyltransferase n=1 Tax=Mycoplasmopsis pullorum TaxID=48003 RepID=UPI00111B5896|nr:pantetheine-phosphate adenylyltransferase [Mycoplasmopsis pullorum]TNK83777.1 pantetheine-phosphate adenylyltransferase [Mycoplasmopsis pullorum]TNK92027.1 pantetheine-phosphate adenylyltransferase [Mycoplasmopsis pullorum]
MSSKIAIYPGSFDPWHQGHEQILLKALKLFDFVYVIVSINPDKNNQGDIQQRYQNVFKQTQNIKNVKVLINEKDFIANIAKKLNSNFIIRSGRDIQDFTYELELAAGNKILNPDLETILIIPNYDDIKFSSTLERHKEKLKNV